MLLQLLMFWQVLLPKQWQVLPICQKISLALTPQHQMAHASVFPSRIQSHTTMMSHAMHPLPVDDRQAHESASTQPAKKHSHLLLHDCPFCILHTQFAPTPYVSLKVYKTVVEVWLIHRQHVWRAVYFALQRLFLQPQGRAPPIWVLIN